MEPGLEPRGPGPRAPAVKRSSLSVTGLGVGWGLGVASCPWQPRNQHSACSQQPQLFHLFTSTPSIALGSQTSSSLSLWSSSGVSDPNPPLQPQIPPGIPPSRRRPQPFCPLPSVPSCLGDPNPAPGAAPVYPSPFSPAPSGRLPFALQLPQDLPGHSRARTVSPDAGSWGGGRPPGPRLTLGGASCPHARLWPPVRRRYL